MAPAYWDEASASWKPMPAEDMNAAAAFLASLGDAPNASPPAGSLRADKARVDIPSPSQGFLFPAPGFTRDIYYQSLTTIARVAVTA